MAAAKKQFIQQVLILSVERIGVTDEVVKQQQRTPLLLLRVLHYLFHDLRIPRIVQVRLWQPHRRPCVVQAKRLTEDEDVLAEQSLVPVFRQSQHVLKHVRFSGVRRPAADQAERRLRHELMRDHTRAVMFR